MNIDQLRKNFIIQAINYTSENFKLSYRDLETLSVLREFLNSNENVELQINKMKKITELSKLGVRLNGLFRFISNEDIDFLKISEQFKNESMIIRDELKNLLDSQTPNSIRLILKRTNQFETNVENIEISDSGIRKNKKQLSDKSEVERLKEEYILEDNNFSNNLDFEEYKDKILRPIKKLDNLLGNLKAGKFEEEEIEPFLKQMKENTKLSKEAGFELITKMHSVFTDSLELIYHKKISITSDLIENMRACLIVIVALIKKKEVDITGYLNKAEKLEIKILSL